ncbi:MAG: cytochrome c biogenesis protein ResB [Candidatus Aminicenantales bacterium]
MNRILKFLGSVKLAVTLFLLLTSASVLGTLIPQQRTEAEYRALFGNGAQVVFGLGLDDLFRSPGFVGLLLLFGLNLSVCSAARLRSKVRRVFGPLKPFDAGTVAALGVHDAFTMRSDIESFLSSLRTEFARRRYRMTARGETGRRIIRARKNASGLFGAEIVHAGVLIILAGGILSGLGQSRADLAISEGRTVPVPGSSLMIRLDRFETEYHPGGSVKSWKSTVSILGGKSPVMNRIIEVNRPLAVEGLRFYQSGYGLDWDHPVIEIAVRKKGDPAYLRTLALSPGGAADLGDGFELAAVRFVPDFVIEESGRVSTRSYEPENPALLIEIRRNGEKLFSGWIFLNHPDFGDLHAAGDRDFAFEFRKCTAPQVSVLQASRDPGAPWIWVGCAVMMTGLFFSFYRSPKEIRLIVEAREGPTVSVAAGGTAPRNQESFREEFAEIMAAARRAR